MNSAMRCLFVFSSLALLAMPSVSAPPGAPEKIAALIFSGHNNHDWRVTTPTLRRLLEESGRFDVRVIEEPRGTTSETFAGYKVIVLDYQGRRWGAVTEKAVEAFVRDGHGLVVVHGASYAFSGLEILGDHHRPTGVFEPPWPEYAQMVGGVWVGEPEPTGHGKRHRFEVKFVNKNNPITKGLGDSFTADDELYHKMKMLPAAQILATAYDDPRTGGTGEEEPILWIVQYGGGRVFHTTLGHDSKAMKMPGFITTLLRGTEWSATGKVTITAAGWAQLQGEQK